MSLVQAMGGELTVTSQPGNTVFTVALPPEPRASKPPRSHASADSVAPA